MEDFTNKPQKSLEDLLEGKIKDRQKDIDSGTVASDGYTAPHEQGFKRFQKGEELALENVDLGDDIQIGKRVMIGNPKNRNEVEDAIVKQVTPLGDGRANIYVEKADDK